MSHTAKPVFPPLEADSWPISRQWSRLDDLCEGVFDCPHTTPVITDEGPYVVRSQDVRTGIFLLDQAAHVSEETYQERIARAEPRFGDILYSREGTYFGLAAEVPRGVRVCLGQRMVLIRPSDKIDTRFLRLWLNSPVLHRHIMGFRDGTVAERLNMPTIRGLPVPHISLPEQRAIAATLGALDDKIELNRKMNATLEAMARALFRDWFVDFGPTRAKAEGRPPTLSPDLWSLFPARLDAKGKPEGWEEKPLTEFFSIIGGGTPKTSNPDFWNGPIPWFSVSDTPPSGSVFVIDTEKTITDAGLNGSSARLVPKGTTIISARGTVGNLAVAGCDMTFNQSCYGLRGAGSVGPYSTYLIAQNMVSQLQAMAHGSVFSTITRQTFESLSLPMPTDRVLRAFEDAASPLFAKILANVLESRTLAALRDLLLPKLMSGEIRVQDAERLAEAAT
ncbi:MAG: restriction endonuclease subunit S [Tabrizicola sp.]